MEEREQHGIGFSNGFLFGLIVGVVLALLFSTKKGRAILRELTEEGKDKFSGLREYLDEVEDSVVDQDEVIDAYDDNLGASEYVAPEAESRHEVHEEKEAPVAKQPEREVVHEKASEKPHPTAHEESPKSNGHHAEVKRTPIRRFFKGVPKRG